MFSSIYYLFLNFFRNLFFHKYFIYFLNFAILQNLIAISLIPIYSSWGIAFSSLSFIGNFIFAPLLTLYLFFSIIIFIGFCFQKWFYSVVFMQKLLVDFWIFLLNFLPQFIPYNLYCFVDLPFFSYPLCWGLVLLFLLTKKKLTIYYEFFISSVTLIGILFLFNLFSFRQRIFFIQDNNVSYFIRYVEKDKFVLHQLDKKKSFISKKKIEYFLVPQIRKNFGVNKPCVLFI